MSERPNPTVVVERRIRLPDPLRVARSLRAPELGPKILFFSGGTALRGLSRKLKRYTHNSIHLITPFDSGGSSAALRDAFGMLSVGDVRNRLLALADESVFGNPEIYALSSYRLPHDGDPIALGRTLESMIQGQHPLISAVPTPLRQIVCTHLHLFAKKMPPSFDLRGASIGNLMLTGGYLSNARDFDSVTFLFSQLLEVKGTVRVTVDADLHLAAELGDGSTVVGQRHMTGKEVAPLRSEIRMMSLVDAVSDNRRVDQGAGVALPAAASAEADDSRLALIDDADVICFPMGSHFTSVGANLLPRGVGRAVVGAGAPRVAILNTAADPECVGMTHADVIRSLVELVARDCESTPAPSDVIDAVVLDEDDAIYDAPLALDEIEGMGIQIVRASLTTAASGGYLDPVKLSELLVSLG